MRCPQCGFDNPSGTKFCGQCGTRLGVPCPACGTLNPEGFAFCGTCGTRLTAATSAPPPVAEERKVVTILFADVTGSTAMAERLDPEQMRGVMARFFQAMADVIGHYEGTVEKFVGDEVMAVFGLPTAHEDDPERAVRAAVAMRERLAELNQELAAAGGVALQMRIGINTGEVVGNVEAAERGEFMVTGDAVNVAARLRGAAEPGMTVVGERTYSNTAALADYRPLSPLTLKGKTLPVAAWELVRVTPEPPRRGVSGLRAPLIGREDEFGLVQGVLQRAIRERRPHLVTILGMPGVGKTRLLEEVQRALPAGVAVRQGRSLPYGSTSLWAIGEIIRTDCGILRSDSLPVMTQKLEQRIADLWGEERQPAETRSIMAHLARILNIPGLAVDLTPESSREDLFWALRRYIERLAGRGPLLLAFEDLHWGDTELLDLIDSMAQWTSGVPVLIVCLTRPELLEVRPAWGGGKRNYTALFLEPLTDGHTRRLLQELLQMDQIPDTLAGAVAVAEGNPFFVEEILRMLIDSGALQRRDGRWEMAGPLTLTVPDTIQGVVTARLDQLSREEKTVLQDAAVLGTRFWTSGLAQVTGESEKGLLPVLSALQSKDFVVEHPRSQLEGQREFAFKNLIIRDIAYAMLPKTRRAEKHRRFGVWLEQTYGDRAEEFADLLAHHWIQAARLVREVGLPDQWKSVAPKALRYTLLAGRKAARVYANEQAITHFQTARALAEELGADAERVAALEGLADVHALQAQWEKASQFYQEALAFHQRRGDAVRQARIQSRIGSTFSGVFDFRQALPHIQSAMEMLQVRQNEPELTGIYLQMARTQTAMGNFGEAEEFARKGLELAAGLGLSSQLAEGHWALGFINTLLGRPEAPAHYQQAIEIGERHDLGWAIQGYAWSAFRHRWRGEYRQALDAYDRALALARETNNRPRIAFCLVGFAQTHFQNGDWTEAAAHWRQYLDMAEEIPPWVEHAKGMLAFLQGNLDEALEWAQKFIPHAERRREVTSSVLAFDWCAFLYLRLQRPAEARQLLTGALERYTSMGVFWPVFYYPVAAEAALALGDVAGAHEACARAESLPWMDIKPAQARLLRAKGLVEAAALSWSDAISLLVRAAELHEQISQPYDRARCLESLADVHVRQDGEGNPERITALRREAVSIYRSLGAEFEVHRIEQERGTNAAAP